jgi:hypothetical protein
VAEEGKLRVYIEGNRQQATGVRNRFKKLPSPEGLGVGCNLFDSPKIL